MSLKPSIELCKAIVDAWKANSEMYRISNDLRMHFCENKLFHKMTARGFLATTNVLASNALFDGMENRAINLMRKHGFGDKRAVSRPSKTSVVAPYKKAKAEYRAHLLRNERLARRAWNVCKP